MPRDVLFLEIFGNAVPVVTGSCRKFQADILVEWRAPIILVINVWEGAPIFLLQAPSTNHQKHVSNFPSTWLANWRYSFWTGQSWHVLKFWYTAGGPEQGFLSCIADRHNRSLVLSVAQASAGKAFEFVTFFGKLCVIACPSQQHYEHLNSGITISFIYIFLEYWDYSRLSINKLNWKSLLHWWIKENTSRHNAIKEELFIRIQVF